MGTSLMDLIERFVVAIEKIAAQGEAKFEVTSSSPIFGPGSAVNLTPGPTMTEAVKAQFEKELDVQQAPAVQGVDITVLPGKGKGKPKAKPAPVEPTVETPVEADPLGAEPEKQLDFHKDVLPALQGYRERHGGNTALISFLAEFGVSHAKDIKPADFSRIIKAANA